MPGHEIIVVGASAGGVETLIQLVKTLPFDLPASVFVVLHIPAERPSLLPDILSRAGVLRVLHPVDHQEIERGCIYVARPDHHLLIERGFVRVVRGPRENRHRPAIDPLFRSAAAAYGAQVVGVVLTGALDDGTSGLWAIKQRGGIAVVQDPKEAIYPNMPESALANVQVDYCLPVAQMGSLLMRLAYEPVVEESVQPSSEEMNQEVRIAAMETNPLNKNEQVGQPSRFSCPECGGVLWELHDGEMVRFRCRTGHAFSPEAAVAEQSLKLEEALWVALKILDEKADLSQHMRQQAQKRGMEQLAEYFEQQSRDAEHHVVLLRQILTGETSLDTRDSSSI